MSQNPKNDIDLDTRIEELEQRLIAREALIRSTADTLVQRAQLAVTPKPWVLPAVGVGVVLWLGWRWWHGRGQKPLAIERQRAADHRKDDRKDDRNGGRNDGRNAPAADRSPDGLTNLPWAGLTAVGWPLLPLAWRARMSPAAATAIVSTVLSIVRRLSRRRIG